MVEVNLLKKSLQSRKFSFKSKNLIFKLNLRSITILPLFFFSAIRKICLRSLEILYITINNTL